ncbi:hypothetical protein LTR65_010264 [Meristemomyces frigidus]
MSFWDRYLAPGDLRQQLQANLPPPAPPASTQDETTDQPTAKPEPAPRIDAAHRRRRKDALLYGGLAFTFLSLFITRRSLVRKQAQTHALRLKTFEPSTTPPPKVDGGLEAAEALGLATLNVFAIAMATAGGLMTFFDVADLEDMRDQVRKGVGFDVYGGESEADRELEAWVADVLSRKDGEGDLKEGIAMKLQELAEMDRKTAEGREGKGKSQSGNQNRDGVR